MYVSRVGVVSLANGEVVMLENMSLKSIKMTEMGCMRLAELVVGECTVGERSWGGVASVGAGWRVVFDPTSE